MFHQHAMKNRAVDHTHLHLEIQIGLKFASAKRTLQRVLCRANLLDGGVCGHERGRGDLLLCDAFGYFSAFLIGLHRKCAQLEIHHATRPIFSTYRRRIDLMAPSSCMKHVFGKSVERYGYLFLYLHSLRLHC
ncbi:hypothetical protein DVJ77_20350 [Dyella tabacisoli]|uniref:Uncharacterized protein n=1 Tax=Dyella tabacisoli TaxID=2282381 RepID=A0A369UJC3_9GAMM|nr:hypothetical protein DVJ77_20350 [Dyella tabacisoli]